MNDNALQYEKQKELILGFTRTAVAAGVKLWNDISFQDNDELLAGMTWDTVCMPRRVMEQSMDHVHAIPYIWVLNHDATQFLVYGRGANGGEVRLRNSSCGFGGHVDAVDFSITEKGVLDPVQTIMTSAFRELNEELIITPPYDPGFSNILGEPMLPPMGLLSHVGCIYEPESDVGSTHLGLVMVYQLAEGCEIKSGEDDISAPRWMDINDPALDELVFENWSKFILKHRDQILERYRESGPLSFETVLSVVQMPGESE